MAELDRELEKLEDQLGLSEKQVARPVIMLIDDDPDICSSVYDALAEQYDIITFENGVEALKAYSPDIRVVLLDIKMHGSDCISIYRKLKQRNADIPIIFFTGYAGHDEQYIQCRAMSPFAIVHKGCDIEELTGILEKALKQNPSSI